MQILVTGGAGFIGTRLVQELANPRDHVVVLDNLLPQVHREYQSFPRFNGNVTCVYGDVRDRNLMQWLFKDGFDLVYHLAALTGVGQSMYQIEEYVDVTCGGTAVLLESILSAPKRPSKIILSSSRAVYGEGACYCKKCDKPFFPAPRSNAQLMMNQWEHLCPTCLEEGVALPSKETFSLNPTSIYGITKQNQEQLCQIFGQVYGVPVIILRYFNVYGPGQSAVNPYTGILSIFTRRLANKRHIEIYEDGAETRDFVYIDDVIRANLLASKVGVSGVFNICSGEVVSVYDVAKLLVDLMEDTQDKLKVTGKYRAGDIRHGIGSYGKARELLNYQPQVFLEDGLRALIDWFKQQDVESADIDEKAREELVAKGLYR